MEHLPNPFQLPGNWYRGCLHCHTTNSDGAMPPQRLIEHYAMGGFDFIAITDHFCRTDATELSTPDFLVLPGIEVGTAAGTTLAGTNYHITGINVGAQIERRDDWQAQELIDTIRDCGGIAIVAHAYWSGLTYEDIAPLRGLLGLEVFNTTTEVAIGRGLSAVHWDDLLTRGHRVLGVAVDDCHRPGFDSLRGWVAVRAPELTAEAITAALRAGHFYCSTGPELLDVRWEENEPDAPGPTGTVSVQCSPAQTVGLIANASKGGRLQAGTLGAARGGRRLRPNGGVPEGVAGAHSLSGAVFELQGSERYARIEVVDRAGRRAWSNPLFLAAPGEALG